MDAHYLAHSSLDDTPRRVSFDDEPLILVDANDRTLGYGSKGRLHQGRGLLHRAFSVFLFDDAGRVLLHQRADDKPLWPGYWTNSCCSHPRRGEDLADAVRRRLREELGVSAVDIAPVYAFEYHAAFNDVGSEHEFCHVFLARLNGSTELTTHPQEIADWCWLTTTEVDRLANEERDSLTPWFLLEWAALSGEYRDRLSEYLAPA